MGAFRGTHLASRCVVVDSPASWPWGLSNGLPRLHGRCKGPTFAYGWHHTVTILPTGASTTAASCVRWGSLWGDARAPSSGLHCNPIQRTFATAAVDSDGDGAASNLAEVKPGALSPLNDQTGNGEEEQLRVSRLMLRYGMLRDEDRRKLVDGHRHPVQSGVKTWLQHRTKGADNQLQSWEEERRERQEQFERISRLRELHKPSHLRRRKQKVKRVQQSEEQTLAVMAANFTDEAQTLSLVEDVHKAEVYEEICATVDKHWRVRDPLSDRLFDILAQAIHEDLTDLSRPTLVNEFTDFDNPYMLKRQAIKRLLEERATRNALDESLIEKCLDRRPDMAKLRLAAKLPPEVVEPLAAFHGLTRYGFDKRTRLRQKVDVLHRTVNAAHCKLEAVLNVLPENQRSDTIHKFHPFRNHFGFVSAVPSGTAGSVTMGSDKSDIEKELQLIRYPTLQRVAHTLPKDPKYRAIVAHAIRVLERSRGWDFKDKVKAINTLIEVYNDLPPSAVYDRLLDDAFPVLRTRGMTRQTKSRNSVFCRGLNYIRSLTTQKPLSARLAKKK